MSYTNSIKASRTEIATFIEIGNRMISHIHGEGEDTEAMDLLPILEAFSLNDNNILVVTPLEKTGFGNDCDLCIESPWCDVYYDIWNYINVEDSFKGAWCVFLLCKAKHVLPLFGHANYNRRHYIFDSESCSTMRLLNKKDSAAIQQICEAKFTSPEVVKADGRYYVSCCYWSDFQGLVKETIEISIIKGRAQFKDLKSEIIITYDCGIRF